MPPFLAGPASLRIEATGAGDDVRELVGSLLGQVELVAEDGLDVAALPRDFAASLGLPSDLADAAGVARASARLALERGVLIVEPVTLDLSGAAVQLAGVVDLYLWAVDLTLRSDAGDILKVVGPLHRPQVRLNGAPGPDQASPAPSADP